MAEMSEIISANLQEIIRYASQNFYAVSPTEARKRNSPHSKKRYSAELLYDELTKTSASQYLKAVAQLECLETLRAWLADSYQEAQEAEWEPKTIHPIAEAILENFRCKIIKGVKKLFRKTRPDALAFQLEGEAVDTNAFVSYQDLPRYQEDLERYESNPGDFYPPEAMVSFRKTGIVPSYDKWFRQQFALWYVQVKQNLPREMVYLTNKKDEIAFNYLDKSLIVTGPCSSWLDEWETRIPPRCLEVWRAWLFSIVDPNNHGRQILWIRDKGYGGKSTALSAIGQALGNDMVGAISKDATDAAYFFSTVYGKRLVVYGDCSNPRLLQQNKIHTLSGKDKVQIERKYENAFMEYIYAKVLIASNVVPQINLQAPHEVSRIIYIPLLEPPKHVSDKFKRTYTKEDGHTFTEYMGDESFGVRLQKEFWHYMAVCGLSYAKLCPNHSDITLSEEVQEKMWDEIPSESFVELEHYLNEAFEIDARHTEWFIDLKRFHEMLRENLKVSKEFSIAEAQSYLSNQYGIHPSRLGPRNGMRTRVLVGIREKRSRGIIKHMNLEKDK